jgi:hypothetical protein
MAYTADRKAIEVGGQLPAGFSQGTGYVGIAYGA